MEKDYRNDAGEICEKDVCQQEKIGQAVVCVMERSPLGPQPKASILPRRARGAFRKRDEYRFACVVWSVEANAQASVVELT
jgi:hypothetical protein